MKKLNLNTRDVQGISQMNQVKGYMLSGLLSKTMMVLFLGIVLFSQGCTKKNAGNPEESSLAISNKKITDEATTSAVGLPGNRKNYVVTVMGGSVNAKFVRLAQYTFTAGTGSTGTVSSQFKYWDQIFTGNSSTNKVATGYTTGDCINDNCAIKTPIGFQPGQAWSTITGTYYLSGTQVRITWTGGQYESWEISSKSYAASKLTIYNSNYDVQHGYGFGSNASFNTGATIAQIKAAGNLMDAKYWQNKYGVADEESTGQWWDMASYTACSTPSMQGAETGSACTSARWHRYVAGNPTTDKRKNYWNHQLGSVTCPDGGGPCISPEAGHTVAMLQVIDDNGVFRGWVCAEASLHAYATGKAIIGSFYYVKQ